MDKKLYFQPQWLAVIIFFLAGIILGALGIYTWYLNNGSFVGSQNIHSRNSNYKFINPLLAIDMPQKQFLASLPIQNKIKTLIDDSTQKGEIVEGSVYFSELESGRWAGVNESIQFSPGDLLRTALMIAYFKNAESTPGLLEQTLMYHSISSTPIIDASELQDGQLFTIREFIHDMMVNENTNSSNILYENINRQSLDDVFTDLGIDFNEDKLTGDYLSTKQYALMLRVLYNATYLNRADSEMVLSILGETNNTVGIAAGLPNDIAVAHEFHLRHLSEKNNSLIEGHDCGIIYFPDHHYQLCVMGTSHKADTLTALFNDISQLIYKDLKASYIK